MTYQNPIMEAIKNYSIRSMLGATLPPHYPPTPSNFEEYVTGLLKQRSLPSCHLSSSASRSHLTPSFVFFLHILYTCPILAYIPSNPFPSLIFTISFQNFTYSSTTCPIPLPLPPPSVSSLSSVTLSEVYATLCDEDIALLDQIRRFRGPWLVSKSSDYNHIIVTASKKFVVDMGYDKSELIGENCKKLQASSVDFNSEANAKLSAAFKVSLTINLGALHIMICM